MSVQEKPPTIAAANGPALDAAARLITGIPEREHITADGLRVIRDDTWHNDDSQYALLVLDTVIAKAWGAIRKTRQYPITRRQCEYLDAARSSREPVQAGDVPVFTARQVAAMIEKGAEMAASVTIRVKVVAGRLVLMPKDGHGWLFECSAWEGHKITYGGRTYTYTNGDLIEDTEDVTGQ